MAALLDHPARACGIDFGTSNSTAGWYRPGCPALLPLENGSATLPSVVFFNAETDSTHYGREALDDYLAGYEGRLMRSMKSLLGSSLIDEKTEVNGQALAFRELLSKFIGELKRRAETAAGRPFEAAVFGRPVRFVDDDDAADRRAETTLAEIARSVGFKEIGFQLEPIAAAFHFESELQGEERVLIVDIGGGTSDFSVARLNPQRAALLDRRADMLANAGVHLGGTDFDKYLSLASVLPLFGYGGRLRNQAEIPSSYYFNFATWHTINFNYTRKIRAELRDIQRDALERERIERLIRLVERREGHWLAMSVEACKIELSRQEESRLTLERIEDGLELALSREAFDRAVAPLAERIGATVERLLDDAQLGAQDIDTVFFTGGSSGIPILRESISELLPGARRVEGDLFGSIGAGLAIEAARRYGDRA